MNLEPIRALLKYIRIGNEGDWNPSWRAATLIKAREAEIALSQILEAVTWIKCSERMPEPETLVLFYTESKSYFIGDCDPVTGWWTKAGKSMTGVIYWLPLSPPEDTK